MPRPRCWRKPSRGITVPIQRWRTTPCSPTCASAPNLRDCARPLRNANSGSWPSAGPSGLRASRRCDYLLRMRALAFFILLTVAVVVAQEKPAPAASSDWDRFVAGYIDGWFKLRPNIAVMAGRHEFDGQLPDF